MQPAIGVHRQQVSEELDRSSRDVSQATLTLLEPELRWLRAGMDLLDRAESRSIPLSHRIRALSAFSRKLDSFFSVAVADLRDRASGRRQIGRPSLGAVQSGVDLRELHTHVMELVDRQYRCWKLSIVPEMAKQSTQLLSCSELNGTEHRDVDRYFCETVYPILTPMAIDASHPKPAFRNKSLYIGALLRRRAGVGPKRLFGVVEVPQQVPRFVPLYSGDRRSGDRPRVALLEEVIGDRLNRLFGGYEVSNWTTFRFTRDSGLRKMWRETGGNIQQIRVRGKVPLAANVVRLEVAQGVRHALLRHLVQMEELGLAVVGSDEFNAIYVIPGPVDLSSLLGQAKSAY